MFGWVWVGVIEVEIFFGKLVATGCGFLLFTYVKFGLGGFSGWFCSLVFPLVVFTLFHLVLGHASVLVRYTFVLLLISLKTGWWTLERAALGIGLQAVDFFKFIERVAAVESSTLKNSELIGCLGWNRSEGQHGRLINSTFIYKRRVHT